MIRYQFMRGLGATIPVLGSLPWEALSPLAGETATSGGVMSGHRAVALVDGVVVLADCSIESHAYLTMGVIQNAVISGEPVQVWNRHSVEELTWNWVAGEPVFLGHGGLLTQLAPVSPDLFILQIGVAITAHRLDVNIQQPIFI